MKKYLKLLRVIFITLCLSLALASCGAGNPNASSSSSQEFGTDSDGGDSQNLADNGWEASEGDDGSEYTATCDFSGEESDGDLVDCKIYWDAKNASNIPLDYSGYSYLVVDNSTFQTSDGYAELRTINPGSYAVKKGGYNSFRIPYGGYITSLFKAEGPNEPHLLDLPLNIQVVSD